MKFNPIPVIRNKTPVMGSVAIPSKETRQVSAGNRIQSPGKYSYY